MKKGQWKQEGGTLGERNSSKGKGGRDLPSAAVAEGGPTCPLYFPVRVAVPEVSFGVRGSLRSVARHIMPLRISIRYG